MALNIISRPSPNITNGRNGYKPEAIVIHIMEGTLDGTDSWFQNKFSKVSAHYGIGLKGDIHQYVNEANCAWHAGRINSPSWSLLKKARSGNFINPNYYTIGIEHEGNDHSDWTEAMYQSSAQLIREICQRHNIPVDRDHIIGHHEIYSLKTCPGSKVSMTRLILLAKGENAQPVVRTPIIPTPENTIITTTRLRIRSTNADTKSPVSRVVDAGTSLQFSSKLKGEMVNGIDDWFSDGQNHFWWAGGVKTV